MAGDGCHLRNMTMQKWLIFVVVVMGILLYMTSDFSPVHRVQTLDQVLYDNVKLKPKIKEDVLFAKNSAGDLFKVDLNKPQVTLEVPFEAYYATLTIVTEPDVASVFVYQHETREINITLALGLNEITVKLMRSNQKLKRMITIEVRRQRRKVTYKDSRDVELCYLEQDCSLIIYSDRECGLQSMKRRRLSEGVDGYWRLKCNDCSNESSCLWSQAEWVEADGEVTTLTSPDGNSLRTCFKDYQLLFVGDSTLRAMMKVIIENVNRTLQCREKKMSPVHYTNVGLNTNFSLSYYNAYVGDGTVTFNDELRALPSKYKIVGKEKKTLLIVGGTRWLTKSHMHQVKDFITKNKISPRNVFVKLYNSAFRIPDKSTPRYLLKPLPIMIKCNKAVKKLAIEYEFGVVDPLQLTLSRYKEFEPGSCGCHFHRVNAYRGRVGKDPRLQQLYHMSGDINTLYTHMLLKKTCPSDQN